MLSLDACAGRSDVGAKAETLARIRAAGLRAVDGVVLLPDEAIDARELAAALVRLGGHRFAVRSSSSLEDAAAGSAAGLFRSLVGVPREEVAQAIAEVRASVDTPAVAAYRQGRAIARTAVQMAVLVQPLVTAATFGVAHSSDEGFAVEERGEGEPEWGDVRARLLPHDDKGELASGLRALEQLVAGALDAEFARDGDEVTWLQARPLLRVRPARVAPSFDEPGRWRLDAEHNPDPLSSAQASLVAYVDALAVGARQRVVGRYLYVERDATPRGLQPIAPVELRRRFDDDVVPDCSRALDVADADGSIDAALVAYAHVYRRYVGEVSPALSQARRALDALLRGSVGEPLSVHGALLAGLGGATLARDQLLWELGRAPSSAASAEYVARFGDHAPSWDVASATDRERPDRVRALATQLALSLAPMERHARALQTADAARETLLRRLAPASRGELATLLATVRQALPIAEDDDLLFLRAQATVRRALLGRAQALTLEAAEDVFELTLDEARSGSGELRGRVAERTEERRAAARRQPPAAFEDGHARWPTPDARDIWRGAATAGQARGRAVVVRTMADAPSTLSPDAVLVVPAIVPSLTPLLAQARALVTDHGGALSHGATLAREYGVPAVLGVGCGTSVDDGVELYVDGDGGRVYVIAAPLDGAAAPTATDP